MSGLTFPDRSPAAAQAATPRSSRRGIHTLLDIRSRCEREGGRHWVWQGYVCRGRPTAHVGGEVLKGMRITACVLGRDGERGPDQRWFAACGDPLCLSPRCLRLGSHAEAHKAAADAGRLRRTPDELARNRCARVRREDVRPAWMVQWALESPQSAVDVASALGVHRSTVGLWRRAKKRPELTVGPFSQLLAVAARRAA